MSLDRYVFAVLDDPCCVVDFELDEINRSFLRNIDPTYFEYLGNVHSERLEGPDRQRAAIALRTTYHHGIETLFTLLGAYVQAPHAVAAWIPRCLPHQLREIVARFQHGGRLLTPRGSVQLMFKHLSADVHAGTTQEGQEHEETVAGFARIWSQFASDFRDQFHQDEYNSIKHGFRVHAGGFVLRAGIETEHGKPAPPENMRTIGGSEFGTSFYTLQGRDGNRAGRSTVEFRLAPRSLNWPIERVVQSLPLLAMSINNIVSKLRLMSGEPGESLRVLRPAEIESFDAPWRYSTGVTSSTMQFDLPWNEVPVSTKESLLRELVTSSPPPAG